MGRKDNRKLREMIKEYGIKDMKEPCKCQTYTIHKTAENCENPGFLQVL